MKYLLLLAIGLVVGCSNPVEVEGNLSTSESGSQTVSENMCEASGVDSVQVIYGDRSITFTNQSRKVTGRDLRVYVDLPSFSKVKESYIPAGSIDIEARRGEYNTVYTAIAQEYPSGRYYVQFMREDARGYLSDLCMPIGDTLTINRFTLNY